MPARRRRGRRPLLVGLAALLVLALAGGGLFLLLRGDELSYAGTTIAEPESVLGEAEDRLEAHVADRAGVAAEDTSCFFRLLDAEGSDVQDDLLCGPVLFVDGDLAATWLQWPLTPATGADGVRMTVADAPADPEPQPLTEPGLLRRPDGGTPADTALEVPPPPRAAPGFTAGGPVDDVELSAPEGTATLSGPAARVTVTELGTAERTGTGDEALRPAEGEVFRVFSYTLEAGEGLSDDAPTLAYRVGDGDDVPVDDALVSPGATVTGLLSAPEDADVTLVVDDGDVTQTLSLVDGSPGPDNLQVTTRTNRSARLDSAQQLGATGSAPGLGTVPITFTITVREARLAWFAGTDVTAVPAAPDRAFLVLDQQIEAPGTSTGAAPAEFWELALPDGTVVAGQDLVPDPLSVGVGFDVPADFTGGTVSFRGVYTYPDASTVDFGTGRLDFPVTIAAG